MLLAAGIILLLIGLRARWIALLFVLFALWVPDTFLTAGVWRSLLANSALTALVAIAVTIAILGIANALLASAVERRRSFALLRAVGASRRQIASAVLLEAALAGAVAVVAAVFAGAAFAALLIGVINPQSFGWSVVVDVPVARLAAAILLVLVAALAAGILPGRIAASADPSDGLAEE